jgi:hypothetical protein
VKPDRVVVSDSKMAAGSKSDRDHSATSRRSSDARASVTKTATRTPRTSTDGPRRDRHSGGSRGDQTINITNATIANNTERSSHRPRHRDRGRDITVDVDINNTVVVKGKPTRSHYRPYITRHLWHDISYVHHRPDWYSHNGFYFSFGWSGNTCGRVVYLPYTYYHSWYHPTVYYKTPCYGLSYYYPRYHRKYVFVSVGGYWPSYRCRRYYWYGCHPNYWYGSYILTEPTRYVTYNIYNNNTNDDYGYGFSSSSTPYYTLGEPKEDIVDEPEYESPVDLCFDHGVTLFEVGNYTDAVQQFREAVTMAPDDVVLPFTYSQALFANGEYALAASVLREAMDHIPDEELTIYYPRGLYAEDTILEAQIKRLESAIAREPFDSDFQLLLGYQRLGMGDLDKAHDPLIVALHNPANRKTAEKLITLAAELEEQSDKSN